MSPDKPTLGDVFEPLAPPPGGLTALRARMAESPRRRILPWLVPAAAALAAVVAVALAPDRAPSLASLLAARGDPSAVALGLARPPAEPVAVLAGARGRLGLERVAVADASVVFYRVGALGEPAGR
jgi:hypothetical protein